MNTTITVAVLCLLVIFSIGCISQVENNALENNKVTNQEPGGIEVQDYGTEDQAYNALENELAGYDDSGTDLENELAGAGA